MAHCYANRDTRFTLVLHKPSKSNSSKSRKVSQNCWPDTIRKPA